MCPELFHRQLADGAWGITLSTAHQVQVGRSFGLKRILVANQIVDPAFADYVLAEIAADSEFDFYCLVDSVAGVEFLKERARRAAVPRPLQLLLEAGMMGGRTGCRTMQEGIAIARAIGDAGPWLSLRGIEGFEGVVPPTAIADPSPIHGFLDFVADLTQACAAEKLFAPGEIVLSAGGSAYFDIVAKRLSDIPLEAIRRIVLRSGCFVSHDSDMYTVFFKAIRERSELARAVSGQLKPALEVLAYVQSRPEPGLAVLTIGKRDCSYDHNLPKPLGMMRPDRDKSPISLKGEYIITALNDQHAFLKIPEGSDLAVGDIVVMGVSHPCTTFDKWDVLYGVDDSYNVVSAFKTYF
jgi:D-serine dehydratase